MIEATLPLYHGIGAESKTTFTAYFPYHVHLWLNSRLQLHISTPQ
jgi:hypothetical protein